MAEYTSSPLGIINTQSIKNYSFNGSGDVSSIFSSKHIIRRQINDGPFERSPLSFDNPSIVHTNEVYDIKTSTIIEKLNSVPAMRLKYADFAYCKDFGVYPNNRLVVCRRFPNFIGDELTDENTPEANSTILTWFTDESLPLDFTFGEEWTESESSFKNVLNDVGKDMVISDLGGFGESMFNSVPLPGITELLQRQILESIGIINPDETSSKLPSGDPNLIKESKRRKLIGVDSSGSGVVGKFQVRVKCSWEQKFINGVDPTFVYYDILRTILSFGGSDARFYLGKNEGLNDGLKDVLKDMENSPLKIVSKVIGGLKDSIDLIKENLDRFLSKDKEEIKKIQPDSGRNSLRDGIDSTIKLATRTIELKYKIPIMGIVNSLTGLPSTPWHVTIGNPLRPIFCSGDMLCRDVNVKLGSQLSFNDLPSYIECEFVLESARNLGVDEIFAKLSSSQIRVVDNNKYKQLSKSPDSWTNTDHPNVTQGSPSNFNETGNNSNSEQDEFKSNSDSSNVGQTKVDYTQSFIDYYSTNRDPNSN